MDRTTRRAVEEYRSTEAGPIENNLIDELVNGELDRQEFLRRGAVFGLSAGIMGSLLGYVGEANAAPGSTAELARVQAGGTLRVGMLGFGKSLEPYLLEEGGSLGFAGIPGEYLTYSDPKGVVRPWLAQSWKPNKALTVWTFQLRKGVKFHNGQTMTSKDVVASFKQYIGTKTSTIKSAIPDALLDPSGISAKGPYTVVFRLKTPNNAFPYLVSQTTYQGIIQPAAIAAKQGTWVKSGMIGTGPFKLKNYVDKKSAELVRNDAYWGGRPPLDGLRLTFYTGPGPQVLALRAGQVDLAQQLSSQEAQPFRNNSKYTVYALPVSAHRQLCMRVDQAPFTDARVRRAVALTLNRPELISKLLLGAGVVGNDSPFFSGFASTDPSIPQRKQNIAQAKALLKAAGQEDLKFKITAHQYLDLPNYAAAIQVYGKQAGMTISIEAQPDSVYYAGDDNTTPWLNAPVTLTEYGARGVPNVYITACYQSAGVWNASKYSNKAFDALSKSYLSSFEVQAQRKLTKAMAGLLLNDTPVVTGYFISYTAASSSRVKNYVPEGLSHVRLAKVSLG